MKSKPDSTNKTKSSVVSSKLGDNRNEDAIKQRILDRNFAQSRDIHESRGTVQSHRGRAKGSPKQALPGRLAPR